MSNSNTTHKAAMGAFMEGPIIEVPKKFWGEGAYLSTKIDFCDVPCDTQVTNSAHTLRINSDTMAVAVATPIDLTQVDDCDLDTMLKNIHSALVGQDFNRASICIRECIDVLSNKDGILVSREFADYMVTELYRCLVDIAMKRYNLAHNRIRDLHYSIMANYISDEEEGLLV